MTRISTNFTPVPAFVWHDRDVTVKVFQLSAKLLAATPSWLFFTYEYLTAHSSDVIYSFILTSKDNDTILAVFNYSQVNHECISCPCSPFGGILPIQNCHVRDLTFLLSCARNWAITIGAKRLTIKTAPACYDPNMHILCHSAYLDAGFYPNHTYFNHYIPIQQSTFTALIEPSERRRLLKGKRLGLYVTMQEGIPGRYPGRFLEACYHVRGYKMPVSAERLRTLAGKMPDAFLTCTAWDHEEAVAMAILVKVGSGAVYHFMSGYLPGYAHCSPSLLLFEAAYHYCQREGMRIFDLGISVDHLGEVKPSLSGFKTKIGGVECLKIIYSTVF